MASIFNSLHIGYTGLNAAQVGINTTSHNITNAENDGYTRQRVVATASTAMSSSSGQIGNGAEIQTIKRVFDNFIFDRYTDAYAQKEYTGYEKGTLEQVSTYFPEIDGVGVKADLQDFYNMWQTFADNPNNDSIKIALAKQTEVLSDHIRYTQEQVTTLQSTLNDELFVNVNEVNSLAGELAKLNKSIDAVEAGNIYEANDLRDKRNVIERDLARLIGAETTTGQLESNIQIDNSSNTKTGSYTVSINGFNIVDGSSFHPLHISNDKNRNGFYELSSKREDGVLVPMEEVINDGKIGSILALRGGTIDTTSGVPKDGILQNTIAQLDKLASGIIEFTNNVYASGTTERMDSNYIPTNPDGALLSSGLNVREGAFNLVVYDIDGNIASQREIQIDVSTTINGAAGSNSIIGQIKAQGDDNSDGNATNDVDDFLDANWVSSADGNKLVFTLDGLSESRGYTFALEDVLPTEKFASGTNFAGALGMNRFFDGNDARSMDLNFDLKNDTTSISAGYTDVAGDSRLALDIVQQQFERYDFKVGDEVFNTTTYGMFDIIATEVGTQTNAAILKSETVDTQFNAIELEYFSTTKVSIDEEMANLIKYQTSYGAAAKVITTIDQMMSTLLGIKQ